MTKIEAMGKLERMLSLALRRGRAAQRQKERRQASPRSSNPALLRRIEQSLIRQRQRGA